MKIAYIIPKPVSTGPIMVVHDLVVQMQAHGHSCTVYTLESGDDMSFPCPVQQISFYKSIDFNDFDIIHTHCFRPDLYAFVHKPRHCRAKIVSTMHNYILRDLAYEYNVAVAQIMGRVWLAGLSRHDKMVTLSRDALSYYRHYFSASKLSYVYNTRDLQDIDKRLSEEERIRIEKFKGTSHLIGVNAVLTERKGIDQVIAVLPRLPQYKLMIVGDGKSRSQLERQAIVLGVQDRVSFWGYQKDAWRYLPYYDCFAMTSRSEGFGLTILEAALFRKKMVCSDIPIFRELLPEHEACFFPLDNLDSLQQAILRAMNDSFLGENLYQRYEAEFSPQKFYQNYLSVYQTIRKGNGRS